MQNQNQSRLRRLNCHVLWRIWFEFTLFLHYIVFACHDCPLWSCSVFLTETNELCFRMLIGNLTLLLKFSHAGEGGEHSHVKRTGCSLHLLGVKKKRFWHPLGWFRRRRKRSTVGASVVPTLKTYLNLSAQPVPGLKILKSNWPCLSPVPIIWNVVSATVGHICEIAFHVISEPLFFLMILHVQMR